MPKKKISNKRKLTLRQELFCQLYASDKEFFGNGVEAYAEAYKISLVHNKGYNTAKVCASQLLTNPNILARIDELLDIYVNDQVVDKELGMVIVQKADLHAKVAAIREYNKVKGRLAPTKFKLIDDNEGLNDDEIKKEINRIREKKT